VLFLLLILWPLAELLVIIKVAEAIGILLTLVLLIASWPIGAWALRSQGRAAWQQLGDAVAAGRAPGREVLNGALVVLGGMLMMIPGFITDVLGVFLLLAPTRSLMRALVVRNLQSRLVVRAARAGRRERPHDVDSTATDLDHQRLRP
jgi:UPF0716 protein FxsA